MAKTAAQRQAAYRARRHHAGTDNNGQRRLSIWLDTSVSIALARLACRYAVTKQDVLTKLIKAEDERILNSIDFESQEWQDYFNEKPLRSNEERELPDRPTTMTNEQRQR